MKSTYVSDLKPGMVVENETFAVAEVKSATDKNGKPYYDLVLTDKTGPIKSKIWSDAIENVEKQSMKVGKVVSVDAKVDEFRGVPQLTIMKLNGVDETKLGDYIESSVFPADELWEDLLKAIDKIENKDLKKLLLDMTSDEEVSKKLKYWPAAKTIHHGFRSGLLQHILEMLAVANGIEKFFPDADFDMVRAGIILHDIGKLEELDGSGVAPVYTKKGSLLGHMLLGIEMVSRFIPDDFPENLLIHIKHIILSHHGTREFGSPVLPSTTEALIIHNVDNVSAKARLAADSISKIAEEDELSEHNRYLGTRLWDGKS